MLEQRRDRLEATIRRLRWMQTAGVARLLDLLLQMVLDRTLLLSQLLGEESESVEAYLDEIAEQRLATVR